MIAAAGEAYIGMVRLRTRYDDRELERHVVRVCRLDGSLLGAGFFVAPGWVLTCAHVVHEQDRVALITVPKSTEPLTATVEVRSEAPTFGELWPYPDLALLRLDSRFEHPCMLIEPAEPYNADYCYAWGFPQQVEGEPQPSGAPALFRFEGRQEGGFLQLTSGEALPGLSGAPLLCPDNRAVVGVISATRNRDFPVGAWASPIAALTEENHRVPPLLLDRGRWLREESRRAVLADRSTWHRVVRLEGSDKLLDRRWGRFVKKDGSSPADLLQADFGVVPYLFRDGDLQEMTAWCESPEVMAVAVVVGRGGAGKTRFAIELCEKMIGRAWAAGHWPDEDTPGSGAAEAATAVVNAKLPRLVVIDYAEAAAAEPLREILRALRSRATEMAPVRVLLLVRSAGTAIADVLDEISKGVRGQLLSVLDDARRFDMLTDVLDSAQREVLFTEAVKHFRSAWPNGAQEASSLDPVVVPDLSGSRYSLPLEVLFEAFDLALAGEPEDPTATRALPPVDRVLAHEAKYWAANAPAALTVDQRSRCVALATLAGASNRIEAATVLVAGVPALAEDSARPLREATIDWLAGLYSGSGLFNPLRPDRLGEALVADLLKRRRIGIQEPGHALLGSILTLPSDRQVAACLNLLARLSAYDRGVAAVTAAALGEVHAHLLARAQAEAREAPDQPMQATVVGGMIRLLASDLGRLLAATNRGDLSFQGELSATFRQAGDLADGSDQPVQAVRLYQYALEVQQHLIARGGGGSGHKDASATICARLGSVATRAGELADAEHWYLEAIGLVEAALSAEPADIARWNLLADYYGELSRVQGEGERLEESQRSAIAVIEFRRRARLTLAPPEPAESPDPDDDDQIPDDLDGVSLGKIITFYAYNGATGRTMALANVAWILAANGHRVLVSDWALNAPGAHRYFGPFLDPATIEATPGLIDMIAGYRLAASAGQTARRSLYRRHASVSKYAISLDWEFPNGGQLDFLSAGRRDQDYSNTVASINWDEFSTEQGGGLFFDALRADIRRNYDYALICSQTGLGDVADICTVQLPDVLVDCFTLTEQSMVGAATLARGIMERHSDRGIRILPVTMRIDEAEKEKADAGRALARSRFEGIPAELDASETAQYWGSTEIPYRPFYAYEETLATFGDRPGMGSSMLAALERLTGWITQGAVTAMPPVETADRVRILGAFSRKPPPSAADLVLAYVPEDRMWADWISAVLSEASFTVVPVEFGSVLPEELPDPMGHRTLAVISPAFARSRAAVDFARAVAGTDPSGNRRQLVPVIVEEVRLDSLVTDRAAADLTSCDETTAIETLLHVLDHPGPFGDEAGTVRFPGSIPLVWNPMLRNADFIGRNSVLDHLRDQLDARSVSVVLPVALYGLGGVGKTQVALEYAHRFKADYDVIWWVDAEQPDQISRSLAELASHLGIRVGTSHTEAAYEVRDKLRRGEPYNRWLLIFDNADDPADVRAFLPSGPGHVVITSRNQSWTQVADPLVIDVFARDEGAELLRRRAPSLTSDEASGLTEVLGDLPLAVDVAAAWLAESGQPVGEYVASLEAAGSTGLLSRAWPADYPRSLEATWKISLDRLAGRSQAALRLLELFAFMAPEISVDLVYGPQAIEALKPLDESLRVPMMLGRVIQEISRLGLVRVDRQGGSIQVHRLMQAYLRDQADAEKTGALVRDVHRILAAARPQVGDTDDPKNWPRYQVIWPHLQPSGAAESEDEQVRQLLIDRVRYLWKIGDFDRGLSLAHQLEGTWEGALSGESGRALAAEDQEQLRRQLLYLKSQRANISRSQGKIAQAAELDQDILAEQQLVLPPDDLHVLITAGGLAADLRGLGRFAEALKLDLTTYQSIKTAFGSDDERTLVAANNLAVDYRLTGDCYTALGHDRDTLDRRRKVLGPAHPHALTSSVSLARDLYEAGDFPEAIFLLQSTYSDFVEVLDKNFVETLRTATLLGTVLRHSGQHVQAKAVTEDTSFRYEEEFNADTMDAYACRLNFAADHAATGEVPTAIDLIREVRAGYDRLFGPKHPFTLIALNNLSAYLTQDGRGAEAQAAARECVEEFTKVLGPGHRYTLTAQSTLANSHALLHEFQEAAALDETSYTKFIGLLKADHPTTLAAGMNLADSLESIGAADRADALRQDLLPLCLRRLGEDHPTTRAARNGGRVGLELEPQPF